VGVSPPSMLLLSWIRLPQRTGSLPDPKSHRWEKRACPLGCPRSETGPIRVPGARSTPSTRASPEDPEPGGTEGRRLIRARKAPVLGKELRPRSVLLTVPAGDAAVAGGWAVLGGSGCGCCARKGCPGQGDGSQGEGGDTRATRRASWDRPSVMGG